MLPLPPSAAPALPPAVLLDRMALLAAATAALAGPGAAGRLMGLAVEAVRVSGGRVVVGRGRGGWVGGGEVGMGGRQWVGGRQVGGKECWTWCAGWGASRHATKVAGWRPAAPWTCVPHAA